MKNKMLLVFIVFSLFIFPMNAEAWCLFNFIGNTCNVIGVDAGNLMDSPVEYNPKNLGQNLRRDEICECNMGNLNMEEDAQTPQIIFEGIDNNCEDGNDDGINIDNIQNNNHFNVSAEDNNFVVNWLEGNWNGDENVIFQCNGDENEFNLEVTPLNDAPIFISQPDIPNTLYQGRRYTFRIQVYDPDGDQITIGWYFNGRLVSETEEYSFIANDGGILRIVISDGELEDSDEFRINVAVNPGGGGGGVRIMMINDCQTFVEAGNYVLTERIEANGTCFVIESGGVYLNMRGNSVTGNGEGSGVYINRYSSFIENGFLHNFSSGISIINSSGNTVRNNVFCYNEGFDINLENSDDNEFVSNQCDEINGNDDIICNPCDVGPHEIELRRGWNFVSSYLIPDNMSIPYIFGDLVEEGVLITVKDERGRYFSPGDNFNNIPEWNPEEAYQVKVSSPIVLVIRGGRFVYPNFYLNDGWNYATYPLTEARDMNNIIENVLNQLGDRLIMVKDEQGRFYSPEKNFNNIPEMRPGKGYMIKIRGSRRINFW